MQNPRAHHRAPTHSHFDSRLQLARAAICVAIGLALLAGCANSAQTQSNANQPASTGDAELDRTLSMMKQWDAMEEGSFDPESLAAKASRETAAAESTNAPASAVEEQARITPVPTDEVQVPAATQTDATLSDEYARPFLTEDDAFEDPDPFEIQLAQFNAPAGVLDRAASGKPKSDKADQGPPLIERLASEIERQPGEPFAKALAWAALSPLVGFAPESNATLPHEASEIIGAVGDLLNELSRLGSDPDPDEAAAIARAFSDALGETRPLEITAAALCRRVDGFGRYHQLRENKFWSGRATPIVVYVEVDHFAHEPVASKYRGPDQGDAKQWEVRLSQEINLYRVHETVPVWTRAASSLNDISRNKRRDFHVTNSITLPAALALGMYELKITMRDLVTGAEAEKMIPIQIVNDAGLLSSD